MAAVQQARGGCDAHLGCLVDLCVFIGGLAIVAVVAVVEITVRLDLSTYAAYGLGRSRRLRCQWAERGCLRTGACACAYVRAPVCLCEYVHVYP